ncbi:MAG: hypothetical protein ACRDVD_00185, partial [Acidimicrobiia bacterium]
GTAYDFLDGFRDSNSSARTVSNRTTRIVIGFTPICPHHVRLQRERGDRYKDGPGSVRQFDRHLAL